jgi:hypothetical protein
MMRMVLPANLPQECGWVGDDVAASSSSLTAPLLLLLVVVPLQLRAVVGLARAGVPGWGSTGSAPADSAVSSLLSLLVMVVSCGGKSCMGVGLLGACTLLCAPQKCRASHASSQPWMRGSQV